MPKLLEQQMSRAEVAAEIVRHARAGESWALLWIGDRFWPKSARLEIDGKVGVHASCRHCEPYYSSEEIAAARPTSSENELVEN